MMPRIDIDRTPAGGITSAAGRALALTLLLTSP